MWKLILVFFLFTFSIQERQKWAIIVLDDCSKWKRIALLKNDQFFSYSRDVEKIGPVDFGFGWIDEEYKLSTQSMTFSKIMDSNPVYTSQLNHRDWRNSSSEYERVFILIPEDYCSEKRFLYDYQFTLYEVKVHVSASTDDLIILPKNLLPLPEVDTLSRKKKNMD